MSPVNLELQKMGDLALAESCLAVSGAAMTVPA